ncbi:outer membrane protein assembly factor BamA [Caldimonas thermodepolymerans]|jgi:outer membrane protein insertion porin family|uniref:Outer membrane protein assembly factor BamA n=1 Tax=Caldimonas thermodepolymerans TaxID=215580 RepID=A0A2S5T1T5_9BURK|nr:outer membrane protein assembly factor BamA [Caldimonas thermodepolymerans]PPE68916.1 outer membrane protein assembly factor BamA [Caldimonas thermodepolymerans]QPC30109.1 outer membrane protein assembly factor BamA [Caldimonas thermodepolymerans]RDI00486.1 Beta-barrel assembly machine subunit BamA [Caldimonas thermodepolymerans]TCP07235.1 Beta-barrel assembly machine subunit BamA [Caldimonas thermodepolymerans]UZG42862.1 outer membrane protein assembly factor BamA [Caldimonas thermodepolym
MLSSSRSHQRSFSLRKPSLIAAAVVAALHAGWAWAVEPFTLRDIRVEGLQRTEPGTVFGSLPFRIGDTYNDEKGAAALRALFATGLFSDVRLEIEGDVVVVVVEERPIVSNVEFVGIKEFDREVLVRALREVGIAEGRPFDKALVDRAEQELKRQYLSKSLYGAEVITTVTPQERNRVNVTFTVTEGGVAKIREIRIVGAKAFPESRLKGLMSLTEGGWMTWYTKSDRYSRAKLNADLEQLRSFYLNRGYLEFSVVSTQVAISPDKQDISITINIHEGQPYVVTAVELEGQYFGKEDDFKSLVTIKPGEPYRAEDVAETVRAFTERFGAFGYAFARVEPQTDIDRETGRVKVVLVANPQRRVYVRRINVAGNTRTRDEVIRRELRQFESAWYDGDRIRLSRDRVDRLGYFNEVSIETNEVPGSPDQVDLTLNVVEKPTGNLLLGAGFSSAEKLTLTASIKQDNIFGSGNYLGFEFNTSKYNQNFIISTLDPYFTIDGISRSIDLYYRTNQPLSSQGSDYKLVTPGAAIRFGVPFTEYDTVYFGIGVESTEIKGDEAGMPLSYSEYRDRFGARSVSMPLTIGWTRDGRDSALVPTRGRYQRLNGEASLAGDARYVKANYQFQQYIPLGQSFTLAFNAEVGVGKGLSGRPLPVFKNFTGGGLGSVRGFAQSSFGFVDSSTGARVGGDKRLNLNTELYVPFPGSGTDRTLRLFGYFDAGNVFDDRQEKVSVENLRASVGIGFSWVSPVGPLKLAYGIPVRAKSGDRIERLQFQIGTAF